MDEVRCAGCGAITKVNRRGRRYCPICDHFKDYYGEPDWKKHKENVQALMNELMERFPHVTWEVAGLGAATEARLDIPPHRKGEEDIKGWWMRKHFVSIEVTGSDSPNISVPPDPLFIRPGKIPPAEGKTVPYFFYLVYPKTTFVVELSVVRAYRRNVVSRQTRGLIETFVSIPWEKAYPGQHLFAIISGLLHQLEPRQSLGQAPGYQKENDPGRG